MVEKRLFKDLVMPYVVTIKNNKNSYYLVRRQSEYREWTNNRKNALVFHYTEKQINAYIEKHFSSLENVKPVYTSIREKGIIKYK